MPINIPSMPQKPPIVTYAEYDSPMYVNSYSGDIL